MHRKLFGIGREAEEENVRRDDCDDDQTRNPNDTLHICLHSVKRDALAVVILKSTCTLQCCLSVDMRPVRRLRYAIILQSSMSFNMYSSQSLSPTNLPSPTIQISLQPCSLGLRIELGDQVVVMFWIGLGTQEVLRERVLRR